MTAVDRTALDRERRVASLVLGVVLILHGLAHANAGMLTADGRALLPVVLWAAASAGFVVAALGPLGIWRGGTRWRALATAAVTVSLALLLLYPSELSVQGMAADIAMLLASWWVPDIPRSVSHSVEGERSTWRRRLRWVVRAATVVFVAYLGTVILARPWYIRWGSTSAELRMSLPGDELTRAPRYVTQRAVTIDAPPDAVWPWLVQLGQDRGGFYSYERLERMIGADIRNADRIHPEWQGRRAGDLVRAVQPDYLGGVFGPEVGWRIVRLEPNRVLVLAGWGAFVLEPAADGTTRLIVRTRGASRPTLGSVVLAPFGLLLFEPAHFIMERRMLLGIKERVERRGAAARAVPAHPHGSLPCRAYTCISS